jgi:serine/threonine-protein kinase HipA
VLAGAQWKLSVRPGERGLVLPVNGQSGSWIAKFHDPTLRDLPRIEFATAVWAQASGVEMPRTRLGKVGEIVDLPAGIPTGDGSVFLIERFDRREGECRVHMEDMAQILDRPPGTHQFNGSHEGLGAILAALCPEDLQEYVRRLVFCVLAGNTDAHLKNWSVLYPDARRPRLSPAYDLVASVLYTPSLEDCLALPLDGSRRFEDVQLASFYRLASVSGLSCAEVSAWVGEAASAVREAWRSMAASWLFTSDERERLEAHMRRVRL